MTFGKAFREIRLLLHWTLQRTADTIGVSYKTIILWEAGEGVPPCKDVILDFMERQLGCYHISRRDAMKIDRALLYCEKELALSQDGEFTMDIIREAKGVLELCIKSGGHG
jgi:transcriptional regulator with XRE-family HTH domain